MLQSMIAIAIRGGKGAAEDLHPVTAPVPEVGRGEILIEVRAAGVNRPDVLQRLGNYPPPPGASSTLGLEVAGVVAVVGPGVERWRTGDQVVALLGGGGYAEYAVVDGRHALPLPEGLDFVTAAALPETIFTVYSNIFEIGGLKVGETLLVHGANSGIGIAAIALAKLGGAKVIATARSDDKLAEARRLGADVCINTEADEFVEAANAFGGADVVLDMLGGEYGQRNINVLKPFGRLVFIATQAGPIGEISFLAVMQRRLSITGSTLRPRDAPEKARLASEVERIVWPWIAAGRFRPVVDSVFLLKDAALAHARLEADHMGKIVLVMN